MTQVTTKQLGQASRGIGRRFSWVEGKKLYLHWEDRQKKMACKHDLKLQRGHNRLGLTLQIALQIFQS